MSIFLIGCNHHIQRLGIGTTDMTAVFGVVWDDYCTVCFHVTHEVGCIHDAILYRMSAVQSEFQDLLLFLPTLLPDHLFFLAEK